MEISGSRSPLGRTLFTPQNPIPQIVHQTSPATERIWVSDHGQPRTFRTPDMEVLVLRRVEEDPGTSMRRVKSAEGISVPLVWRTLHERSLYPHHSQRVQALTPDRRARAVFCQWLLAKWVVNAQFVPNILFTDEAGFIGDGNVNIHMPVSEWMIIPTSPWHQHRFSISVWVGILPNRLTCAVYHSFWQTINRYSWNICLFIHIDSCGSGMTEHYLIFSTLSQSTWTRLSVNSGQDAEAQSTGLHDLLTFTLWILGCRDT
jgi:hypothetical protein